MGLQGLLHLAEVIGHTEAEHLVPTRLECFTHRGRDLDDIFASFATGVVSDDAAVVIVENRDSHAREPTSLAQRLAAHERDSQCLTAG